MRADRSASCRAAEGAHATNQEGVYWRYEMALRARESRLSSITAGNGAIYATRRESYIVVDPIMGHDLSFPFNMVKRGWRAVYVPSARATEKMVPSIEGEWRRKRRMMSHTWPIVLRGGMLSPRGYSFGYAAMIFSHRLLRYLTPFLHAFAFLANIALVAGGTRGVYEITLILQVVLGASAGIGGLIRVRPLLIARYYFLTTLSAGRRPVGLAAPRHRPFVGSGRGDEMIRRAIDIVLGMLMLIVAAPVIAVAMLAIRLRVARPPDLPSTARRQGWPRVRPAQAAHDGRRRRAHGRRPGDQRERPACHASGGFLAPNLAG